VLNDPHASRLGCLAENQNYMGSETSLRVAHFTLGRCRLDSANGVEKSVYHLARTQAALGHDVGVFSLSAKPPIPIPGVSVSTSPARSPFDVPKQFVASIVEWRPDVLHLHSVHVPANVFLARRLSSTVPYCVTIHGGLSPVAQKRNRWAKRIFRFLFEHNYLERAAFLHAISQSDVQGLTTYGVTNTTVLAPNGIDVEPLPPLSDSRPGELDTRIQGKRIFLFLGRLDPAVKGLDVLLQAFAASRPDNSVLVLVGPDWRGGRRRLETLATSLRISDAVVFAGPAFGDRKIDWLCSADVLVHPSRTEAGVPFSVLEAAAVGRPFLLTAVADPAGVLERAGAAVTVASTVDSIAAGLRQMSLTSRQELREMGARARDIVKREFSWSRTAGILIDAYRTHALRRR
jgi:glycosyltransferase involved in cell wall biosynthesis